MKDLGFMAKIVLLFALLLLGCNKDGQSKPECDAVCELQKEDFERLTTKVTYRVFDGRRKGRIIGGYTSTSVTIKKTPTGAIAYHRPWGAWVKMPEAELSMEEWQGFIKSLYKSLNKDFDSWDGEYEYSKGTTYFTRALDIEYQNQYYQPDIQYIWQTGPSDWDGVEKLMTGMVATIRERAEKPFEDKLKAKYLERFGEPMSDFELSVTDVNFWLNASSCFPISVSRTETETSVNNCRYSFGTELNVGDWLDFVRALHKSGADRLEKKYGEPPSGENWALDIYSSWRFDMDRIEGYGAYPPNWDELKKSMEDMNARIWEKSGSKKKGKGR